MLPIDNGTEERNANFAFFSYCYFYFTDRVPEVEAVVFCAVVDL